MLNYLQPGNIVEVTAPAGGVVSGAPVVINQMIGIAATTEDAAASVNIQITGVFTVTKKSAEAWAEGSPIYWDAANEYFTITEGGLFAGLATAVAANPSSTGSLLLVPGSAYEGGFHIGTDSVPLVDDTVGVNFMSAYFDSGATSGASIGLKIVLKATGVMQTYSTGIHGQCDPSVQVRNPVGVQGDLIFGAAGWIQGLGYCVGGYLSLPAAAVAATGNVACLSADINAPASCDVSAATRVSCVRIGVGGAAQANFETKATFFSFVGFTATAGVTKMLSSTSLAELPAGTLGIRVGVGGGGGGDTMYYIPLVVASEWNA